MIHKSCLILVLLVSTSVFGQETAVTQNFLLGKFDYRQSADFEKVDRKYSSKTLYLNSVAYQAFREMFEAAKKDSINLKILSGTRDFYEQKVIWEKKWTKLDSLSSEDKALAILQYSAMPATSRHHWGTDIDLNNLENSYFEEGSGKAEYEWLVNNAGRFGFYQVYTAQDSGRTGYKEEKWHWSYLPLAARYLEEYNKQIDYCEIAGFEGSELAEDNQMISDYVNGIPQELRYPSLITDSAKKLVLQESSVEE